MGTSDPRLNLQGKLDTGLQQLFQAYQKQEPPVQQVKPIPLSVVTKLLTYFDEEPDADEGNLCIADMICLGFLFMLRSGKHTKSDDNTPFKLQDVKPHRNVTPLPITTVPIHELDSATHVSLTFTTHKNGQGHCTWCDRTRHCVSSAHSGTPSDLSLTLQCTTGCPTVPTL